MAKTALALRLKEMESKNEELKAEIETIRQEKESVTNEHNEGREAEE